MNSFRSPLLVATLMSANALHSAPLDGQAWGANIGRVLPSNSASVLDTGNGLHVLAGPLHSANCGWIALGDGTPDNGNQYSNATGTDSGVNCLADGTLRGLAWSANLGWIHFEATGDPRLDLVAGTFSGYAWCANAGWLRLDGLSLGVPVTPPAPQPDSFGRALHSDLKLTPTQLLGNDTNAANPSLMVVSVQDPLPAGATVSFSEGWIFYTAPAGYAGSGSFTYTVMNPDNLTATTTVEIHVDANPDQETGNRLAFEVQPGGAVSLQYLGIPGRTYSIQATESLSPPVQWTTLGTVIAAPNGLLEWLDLDAPNHPQRFYRTEAPANP